LLTYPYFYLLNFAPNPYQINLSVHKYYKFHKILFIIVIYGFALCILCSVISLLKVILFIEKSIANIGDKIIEFYPNNKFPKVKGY